MCQIETESGKHAVGLQSLARLAESLHKCVDDLTSHILFWAVLTSGGESEFLTTKIVAFPFFLSRETRTWKHKLPKPVKKMLDSYYIPKPKENNYIAM